ncbi:MAG: FHA domain-containing protein [Gammaproteobacteria bacterium]|nr:FHA domain-containing protein [Gammaproteobacteria bacterium]MCP4088922.1 FHA domain-containing protein [Gammaproteobacteria bacterium]
MPLQLQIVSAHRESMGGAYIQEFTACGGSIGRSLECDWPLPDSKRYISSKHAMINFQDGCYYLVDLSRNGVYINGSDLAVGNGNSQRLFDDDIVRFGEFEIKVALIEDISEADQDGMSDSVARAQMVQIDDESIELAMVSPDSMNDGIALDAMLTPGGGSGELSMLSEELPPQASAELLRTALDHGISAAAEEFLCAAGMDPDEFKAIDPKELLKNAAHLLANLTNGVHALLNSKDAITARLNLNENAKNTPNNPLRSADSIDNALRLLLTPDTHKSLGGPEAADAAFDELLNHQRAVMAAMRIALKDYLGCFEPDALEIFFTAQKKSGNTTDDFRERYAQAYEALAQLNNHMLPQRFDDEFTRAYELQTTK